MEVYGGIWWYMNVYGGVWVYMWVCGGVWGYVRVCGGMLLFLSSLPFSLLPSPPSFPPGLTRKNRIRRWKKEETFYCTMTAGGTSSEKGEKCRKEVRDTSGQFRTSLERFGNISGWSLKPVRNKSGQSLAKVRRSLGQVLRHRETVWTKSRHSMVTVWQKSGNISKTQNKSRRLWK